MEHIFSGTHRVVAVAIAMYIWRVPLEFQSKTVVLYHGILFRSRSFPQSVCFRNQGSTHKGMTKR